MCYIMLHTCRYMYISTVYVLYDVAYIYIYSVDSCGVCNGEASARLYPKRCRIFTRGPEVPLTLYNNPAMQVCNKWTPTTLCYSERSRCELVSVWSLGYWRASMFECSTRIQMECPKDREEYCIIDILGYIKESELLNGYRWICVVLCVGTLAWPTDLERRRMEVEKRYAGAPLLKKHP